MNRKVDLTGLSIHGITVIKMVGKTTKYQSLWLCRCGCGNEMVVRIDHVRQGVVCRSCGHNEGLRPKTINKPKIIKGIPLVLTEEIIASFWQKVNKSPGCWEWNSQKYGVMTIHGLPRAAHRVSWQITHGAIPDGLFVLHKCDNPRCVRPDHLFIGTQKDNIADRDAKGRRVKIRWERHPFAKLTWEAVRDIRNNPLPASRLASSYGVTESTITAVRRRELWKEE